MILQSILNGVWFIDEQRLLSILPKIATGIYSRQKVLSQTEIEESSKSKIGVSSGAGLHVISEFGGLSSPEDANPGSIAVIGFNDVIMTEDDLWYGTAGTKTKNNLLQRALQNDNIEGVIFYTNSPGGEAGAGERIVETVRGTDKPVFTFIDGIDASAMYHITAPSDEVFIMSEYDEVGSIGTYVTLSNMKGLMSKIGIDIIELYATESTMKNEEVRKAFDEKAKSTEKLQAYVDHFQGLFKESVMKDRGEKIKNKDAYKGKLFLGSNSIDAGLVDGKANFDSVVGLMEEHITRKQSMNKKSYILI